MTSRQLEAGIRKLCDEALRAEQRELESVFLELRVLLHEYNELLRELAAELALGNPQLVPEAPLRKRNIH